jgi:hypothetical protein
MRKKLILGGAVVFVVGSWYAFRPERLFIDKTVNEAFDVPASVAASGPLAILAGDFHSGSHETSGRATIYTSPDGSRTLRLTDFRTSNGPDVRVYLVAAEDATDDATVTSAGFIDLGAMKGNVGDQNYDLPADLDLDRYRSVTIWCKRFSVNFGTAPLRAAAIALSVNAAQSAEFTVKIEHVSTEKTLALSNGLTAPARTSPGRAGLDGGRVAQSAAPITMRRGARSHSG